ncbi:MAG: hypothetical protein FWE23_07340 [Chitinivibrionia bacterium]|nr:hypothetical protein [Chitinivibrionia bacterium]
MKKLLVFLLMLSLLACSSVPREIRMVQDGQFDEFDFTVKQLVQTNWENPLWRVENGKVIVSGELDNEGERMNYALEFSVDKPQNTFEFERLFINGEEADDFSTMMIITIMALTTAIALDATLPE